jgi:hypothetical protein
MEKSGRKRWRRWVLIIPFIAILDVPFYNRMEPELFGLPFFYWYQLAWILIAALIIFLLHRTERREGGELP